MVLVHSGRVDRCGREPWQHVGVGTNLAAWRARVIGLVCVVTVPNCAKQPESRTLELGVSVRLNGVSLHSDSEGRSMMAVGESGSVAWRDIDEDASLQTWTLGDTRLHDVGYADLDYETLWFVVGTGGAIHVAHQRDTEFTWFGQDSGVVADLHALMVIGSDALEARVLVVGDEVVLLGQASDTLGVFTWTIVAPPAGGWGRLRGIGSRERRLPGTETVDDYIVVGEAGRAWIGDLESEWQPLDLGTDRDLHDGGYNYLCGDGGTIVDCGEKDSCSTRRFGEVDFVSCRTSWLVDEHARIFEADPSPGDQAFDQFAWQPRAAASDDGLEVVLVGDGGRAILWWSGLSFCE